MQMPEFESRKNKEMIFRWLLFLEDSWLVIAERIVCEIKEGSLTNADELCRIRTLINP